MTDFSTEKAGDGRSARLPLAALFGRIAAGCHAGVLISAGTVLFVSVAALAIIMRLTKNYLRGSFNTWQQGDWLIHRDLAGIRRGHIGSWLLDLSDLFAVGPLSVVFVLHVVLVAVLFYLLIRVFLAVGQPLVLAPFLFSPPLFVIFWLPWEHGALRKETLAFIAILLLLLACIKRSRLRFLAASALFALSVYGHEANILFLPLFLGVLWLCRAGLSCGLVWLVLSAGHCMPLAMHCATASLRISRWSASPCWAAGLIRSSATGRSSG